jgi:tellurite resistance protein TerC
METVGTPALYAGFIAFVLAMLALDLGVFHKHAHVIRFREALGWSVVWVSLALLFNLGVWLKFGHKTGMEFLTGYVIEKSLSVDNIFVIVLIFSSLGIPAVHQHRVLFWGILSALVLRALMIFAGTALLARFHWLIYVFGGFLVFTGVKILLQKGGDENPEDSWAMKWVRRAIPTTPRFDGSHFFTVENGRRLATPLFLALVLVELTDAVFALDSIPAIFAVTLDPFIVFTSNIFAILGLRSLFFLLAGMVEKFRYLKLGLSAVLIFVGTKMIVVEKIKIHPALSLLIITLMLGISIVASIRRARREERELSVQAEHDRLNAPPKQPVS